MNVKVGDKVTSKISGRTYEVATFSDRYTTIDIEYVKRYAVEFTVISGGGANG